MRTARRFWTAGLVALACSADPRDDMRGKILEDVTYGVILPNLRDFAARASELRVATETFRADPTAAHLDAARIAWTRTRSAWDRSQAHLVGPEQDLLLEAKIETVPTHVEKIDALAAASPALDAAAIDRLGANVKGLPALEVLLYDAPGAASSSLAAMTTDAHASQRRDLLVALASDLESVAAEIRQLWEPEGGGFAIDFATAGTRSSSLATRDAAFDLLINRMVYFTEWLADVHFAWPAGRGVDPPVPQPDLVRSRRSGRTIQDATDQLEGLRNLYQSTPTRAGLGALVAHVSPALDADMRDAFEHAAAQIAAIPPPLDVALTESPEAVRSAFESVKGLQVRTATDLVSVYQTTLRVVRFDGD